MRPRSVFLSLTALASVGFGIASAHEPVWERGPGYRSAALPVPTEGHVGFTRIAGSLSGILFSNTLARDKGNSNQLRLNGSGVAAGDVDGDGRCDLYFCGLEGGNRLYRNLGDWKFDDVTEQAGVSCRGQVCTGAVFADVDGDGSLDLLVNSIGGGTKLFLNDGKGHFHEATDRGLSTRYGPTTMALGDIDGNGSLDLYVANNNSTALGDQPDTRFTVQIIDGKPIVTAVDGKAVAGTEMMGRYAVSPFESAIREYGEADILYLNDAKGHFTPLSWTNGTFLDDQGKALEGPPRDWGLSAMFRDMNGDGAPDIYVCNDLFTPDRIWLNDGHGHFRASSSTAVRNSSAFSMGMDFADVNRDGYDDFFVVDMLSQEHQRRMIQVSGRIPVTIRSGEARERLQIKRNVLQLNRGDGTYAEIAQLSGIEASEWSWTAVFLDVDLDGYEDLIIPTGHERDSMNADADAEIQQKRAHKQLSREANRDLGLLYPKLHIPIQAFRNMGDLRFRNVGREWGFDRVGVRHGICCADLDGDGDLDVITNDLNDEAGVYRNEGIGARVGVRLKGMGGNSRGIGSKIWVYGGAVPVQSQEMICGGRYLSSDEALRVFAAGSATNVMRIEVRWRSGKRSVVEGVRANREYEIEETGAVGDWPAAKPEPKPVFEEASQLLKHVHRQDGYNDMERQVLLPRKLSTLGPGVSWSDVDGDGREDLLISGGRGGQLDLYLNRGTSFEHLGLGKVLGPNGDEQTTVLGWVSGQSRGFMVGQGNYVSGGTNRVRRYELWAGGLALKQELAMGGSSIGPMALGDVNGDGNLGLFVGGRVNAGRWPEAASSKVYRWEGGKHVLDEANSQKLERVGMVSGAVWSDLDGDGLPELVLACEWGPIKIFHNERGQLVAWDPKVRLHKPRKEETGGSNENLAAFKAAVRQAGMPALQGEVALSQLTGWWTGVAVGDFDGDGRMDVVAGNWGSNSKYELGRKGAEPLRVYYGDLDGDGALEVVEGYYDGELKKVVPWRTLSSLARGLPWVRERYPTHASYSTAGIEEILGERFKQVQGLEARLLESTVLLNRGDHFDAVVLPGEAQYAPCYGVSVGDLDGDGKEDVYVSQNFFGVDEETSRCDGGRGVWLRGDGRGGFEVVSGQESGLKVYGEGRGSALSDYDGDGRVDLVVGEDGGQTKLYHNVGAKPGLRVRLVGPAGNPSGVGAQMRLRFGENWGPAREVHGGSGYWSQDGAVQVLGTPQAPTALWVRWPGGKTQEVSLAPDTKELKVVHE